MAARTDAAAEKVKAAMARQITEAATRKAWRGGAEADLRYGNNLSAQYSRHNSPY